MPKRNFDNLTFALYEDANETKMFESYYKDGSWDQGSVVQFHNLELSPSANILNYGQGIFEGMKAYRSVKGKIVMFRPEENAKRFADSCINMAMPEVPVKKFMKAVRELVMENLEFIPDAPEGNKSLYVRPVCIATEPMLGVKAATEYLFYIYVSPVGMYYDTVGVTDLVVTDVHRAAPRGTGAVKAVCNYPVTMPPRKKAMADGFGGIIFLDAKYDKYVEEADAANFFVLLSNDTLVTPQLGSILPGITRASILQIASELFGIKTEERNITIEEVIADAKEVFLCGTGATITSVRNIGHNSEIHSVNKNDFQFARRVYNKLIGIQLQKEEDPFEWVTVFGEAG